MNELKQVGKITMYVIILVLAMLGIDEIGRMVLKAYRTPMTYGQLQLSLPQHDAQSSDIYDDTGVGEQE